MPEPLSAQLRRLHEEATPGPWGHEDDTNPELVTAGCDGDGAYLYVMDASWSNREPADLALITTLRNTADALADLVKFVESIADDNACHLQPMHERGERADCVGCCASGALAALRERLEAK